MNDMMAMTQMRHQALREEAEARRLAKLALNIPQQPRRSIGIGRIIQTLLVALR